MKQKKHPLKKELAKKEQVAGAGTKTQAKLITTSVVQVSKAKVLDKVTLTKL